MNLKNKIYLSISIGCFILVSSIIYTIIQVNHLAAMEREVDDSTLFTNSLMVVYGNNYTDSVYENKFPIQNSLVYCFSEDMCDECITQDLEVLSEVQHTMGKHIFIIVTSYSVNRTTQILWKNKLNGFRYTLLQHDSVYFPIDRRNGTEQRFFIFVNNSGKNEFLFCPQKNQKDMTCIYLRHMGLLLPKN